MADYQKEFPGFELDVAVPPAWEHTSWRNDSCPSFLTPRGHYQVFVDHKNDAKREFPGGSRFSVHEVSEEYTGDVVLDTDDWAEVLAFVSSKEKTHD